MDWLIDDLKVQIAICDHTNDIQKVADLERAILLLKTQNRDDILTKQVSRRIKMFWDNYGQSSIVLSALEITDIAAINNSDKINVVITLCRPGLLIGKGGRTIDELREYLFRGLEKKIEISIIESKLWR